MESKPGATRQSVQNKRKEESTQSMSTVEGKKQEKRRALLDAAYELFLERGTAKTSVEDITSRAKVAKGTFYLYFQDKGAVMQALLGRVSYQLLSDACTAVEQQTGLESFAEKMVFVIDHIIESLRKDTVVLRFLERNFVWPGLDQIEASKDAEPLMRKLLTVVMSSPEMAGRTEREIYQRITALGSMCMSVCYSSILEGKPDNIDNMKPVLYDIIRRALRVEKAKELLTEAGYPNGFDMTITVPSNYQSHMDTAQVIVEQLKAVGINAAIQPVTWESWVQDTYSNRQFQSTVVGVDASNMTARAMLERFVSTASRDFINYNNADYDALFAQAQACYDDEEQTAIYRAMEKNLAENAANVYIQDMADFVAVRDGLEGPSFYPIYVLDLSTIHYTK